jgi:hypothetical protein
MIKRFWNSTGVATTGFSGAAPQTVAGATIAVRDKINLSALIYAKATVNTLTLTAKWQVSLDGSTWRDVYGPNRATNVVIVTGTGSAVTDTIVVQAPEAVYGYPSVRCIVVSGVGSGSGAGSDEASITYYANIDQSL